MLLKCGRRLGIRAQSISDGLNMTLFHDPTVDLGGGGGGGEKDF